MIVFDVGANNGDFSRYVLEKCPVSKVYAFEPNKSLFQNHLKSLKSDYPHRFFYYEFALAKDSKKGNLYGATVLNGQLASTIQFNTKSNEWKNFFDSVDLKTLNNQAIEIDIISVKDFLKAHKILRIDFLKIDTQGTDLEIMEEFVSFAEIESGVAEIDIGANSESQRYYSSKNDINNFNRIVQNYGLSVYRITANNPNLDELNIFFAKSQETYEKNIKALAIAQSPPFYKFWVVQGIGVNKSDISIVMLFRLVKKVFIGFFHPRRSFKSLLVKLTK